MLKIFDEFILIAGKNYLGTPREEAINDGETAFRPCESVTFDYAKNYAFCAM